MKSDLHHTKFLDTVCGETGLAYPARGSQPIDLEVTQYEDSPMNRKTFACESVRPSPDLELILGACKTVNAEEGQHNCFGCAFVPSSGSRIGITRQRLQPELKALHSTLEDGSVMNTLKRVLFLGLLALASSIPVAIAQTDHLSIPSSGFTPQLASDGYTGNESGTARHFLGTGTLMFAPVNLPDGVTVKNLRCGGRANSTNFRMLFTLRGNRAQVLNVDLAEVATSFEGTGFQFTGTTIINEPVIDNATFNYYIIATVEASAGGSCGSDCLIGFCRIEFAPREIFADRFED
jgi:hypothetical protein